AVAVALEEVEIRPGVVVGDLRDGEQMLVELGDVAGVVALAEHRDVHDLDVDVARLVLGQLLGPAEVDDALDAVTAKRPPPVVGEAADVVRTDDSPLADAAAVLGRQAAEVTNVQAAVPDERR